LIQFAGAGVADGETYPLLSHIEHYLPRFRWHTVFDVGANVGEFAFDLARRKGPKIYAFEPAPSTFRTLVSNVNEAKIGDLIEPIGIALSDVSGDVKFANVENDKNNAILANGQDSLSVKAMKGDQFCEARSIHEIDFLKIDTEGHDLKVIHGFERMLSNHSIGLVEAEVSMTPTNSKHVQFEEVKSYLETKKYHLFFIYEQFMDVWFTGRAQLRRCNPVFISECLIEANLRERYKFA
jgi:FkbM family methyltransferase